MNGTCIIQIIDHFQENIGGFKEYLTVTDILEV